MSAALIPRLESGAGAVELLADEWVTLWRQDPAATMFQRPEFLRAWLAHLGSSSEPVTVAMRDAAGSLRGIVAVQVDEGVLRFLGDHEISDYLGPVGEDADAIASAFVEGLGSLGGWTAAELHCLAADTAWPDAVGRAAKAAGWQVEERRQDVCPRVSLEGGFDQYLLRLPGKLRHEMRRKERRLAREAGEYTIRLATADSLAADLDAFFQMHRAAHGPKGKFLHEGMAGFFTTLAETFLGQDALRLVWLETGGEQLAGLLAFRDRATWRVYNSAYDHRRRQLAPGMVLVGEAIRLAADEGCTTFDLLRGDEPYKYRFGAVDVPLLQLSVRRP